LQESFDHLPSTMTRLHLQLYVDMHRLNYLMPPKRSADWKF